MSACIPNGSLYVIECRCPSDPANREWAPYVRTFSLRRAAVADMAEHRRTTASVWKFRVVRYDRSGK